MTYRLMLENICIVSHETPSFLSTVNVDIFTCMNIRGFKKIRNFARIKIHVLSINGSIGYHKKYFSQCLYFHGYLRNANYAKIYTV